MHPIVYHLVSGQAFFSGLVLAGASVLNSLRTGRRPKAAGRLTVVIASLMILLSSTPGSWWLYGATAGLLIALPACPPKPGRVRRISAAIIVACCGLAAMELPWHISPTLPPLDSDQIIVIGDSVTAGFGGDDTSFRWPSLVEQETGIPITDFSHVGETAASALKRIEHQPLEGALAIVEIGGNDLLGATTVAEFEASLDALLRHLATDHRCILMFELPLPPLCHGYGAVQRKLAERYHVALIPKRILLQVVSEPEATLDSIHLTQDGHRRLAEAVLRLLTPAPDAE